MYFLASTTNLKPNIYNESIDKIYNNKHSYTLNPIKESSKISKLDYIQTKQKIENKAFDTEKFSGIYQNYIENFISINEKYLMSNKNNSRQFGYDILKNLLNFQKQTLKYAEENSINIFRLPTPQLMN